MEKFDSENMQKKYVDDVEELQKQIEIANTQKKVLEELIKRNLTKQEQMNENEIVQLKEKEEITFFIKNL